MYNICFVLVVWDICIYVYGVVDGAVIQTHTHWELPTLTTCTLDKDRVGSVGFMVAGLEVWCWRSMYHPCSNQEDG